MTPTERKELFSQAKMLQKATLYLNKKGFISANGTTIRVTVKLFQKLTNKRKTERAFYREPYDSLSFIHDGLTYVCLVPRKVGK